MLVLGTSGSLDGQADTAATVNCTVMGCATNNAQPPVANAYQVLAQTQIAAAMAAVYSTSATTEALISSIHLYNTGVVSQTVTMAINGTATTNVIAVLEIPAGGYASYEDGAGWTTYSNAGVILRTDSVSPSGLPGGLGTPNATAQNLTASAANVVSGTLFQLPTNALNVGSRFRFELGITKTAAGTATWTVAVKWGTAGTAADAAIASWISGTNTAAIDQATLAIEVYIASVGAAATATCISMYVNTLTNATGLGIVNFVPSSTAAFNSAAATPFMHVDITPGASAVMQAVGSAERLV